MSKRVIKAWIKKESHNKKFISLIIVLLLLESCLPLKRISNRRILKQSSILCKDCYSNYLINSSDTVFKIKKNTICIFKNKKIFAVGKIVESQKTGRWIYYLDSCRVDRVVDYSEYTRDSVLLYRSYTVNESW